MEEEEQAAANIPPKWWERRLPSIPDLLDRLGHWNETCLHYDPPGDDRSIWIGEPDRGLEFNPRLGGQRPYVIDTQNDGFELWIGTRNRWIWHCRQGEALQIAWFILWTWWARSTWFGVRRAIWYWALNKRCERWKRAGPR